MGYKSKYSGKEVETKLDSIADKQDMLVSGENIKTFNGESILGEGNIEVGASGETEDLEMVTAAAITDLNKRINGLNGRINGLNSKINELNSEDDGIKQDITALQNDAQTMATKNEVSEAGAAITNEIKDNEKVTAAALNEMWLKIEDIITRLTALENK